MFFSMFFFLASPSSYIFQMTPLSSFLFPPSTDRMLPMWCKSLDIMFAKAHFIEDSHAMLSLDSRLGTAFNFVLLLVVVGLFSYVFTAPNTLRTNTLVPTSTMGTNTTYGYLNVTIEAFAPRAEGDGFAVPISSSW